MKFEIFDIDKGIYLTQLYNLKTDPHQHPATEIAIAEKGEFRLTVDHTEFEGVRFALIESNVSHAHLLRMPAYTFYRC